MTEEQVISDDTISKLKNTNGFKDMDIRRMKLTDIYPADYNPRQISPKAFNALGASIEKFGILIPIVWNERTGNIVGGHQRFKHLVGRGTEETDVVVVDLDTQDEVALNITLNSKELRGQFTEDAVRLLKLAEAQMGSAFNEVALLDLHNALLKKLKKPKDKIAGNVPSGPEEKDDDEPVAVITCPNCRSCWRMSDNEVIVDATKEGNGSDEQ
jgi:ParB-like chromosome segregation protein Spo0J